jgi:hypothetical protein
MKKIAIKNWNELQDRKPAYADQHPQPYKRDAYQGIYQDPTGTVDEPYVKLIRKLSGEGLSKVGHHGPSAAMGVIARAAGHRHLSDFTIDDLTTFKKDMAQLTGVAYGGVS